MINPLLLKMVCQSHPLPSILRIGAKIHIKNTRLSRNEPVHQGIPGAKNQYWLGRKQDLHTPISLLDKSFFSQGRNIKPSPKHQFMEIGLSCAIQTQVNMIGWVMPSLKGVEHHKHQLPELAHEFLHNLQRSTIQHPKF